jgi:hypothetical protein
MLFTGLAGQGGAVGSFFGQFVGKEKGGPVQGSTPYIVGERGPELFVPKTSGDIVPNSALSTVSAPSNVVNLNITAMDSQNVIQALGKVKREAATLFNSTNASYNLGVT